MVLGENSRPSIRFPLHGMTTASNETRAPTVDDLADVIEHIAREDGRAYADVASEVRELAHRYRNVMQQDLMPLGQYTTQDRVSAITCMRHYMEEGERSVA